MWQHSVAGITFAAAMVLMALGRFGRFQVQRGTTALVAGLITAATLGISWRVIDVDVMLLLAGLMVLASLALATGLFDGTSRLESMRPATALRVSILAMMACSAILLNDAAVIVLLPLLLVRLMRLGLEPIQSTVLMVVGANVGSLATPFGNPQNAALAAVADLSVLDFVRQQGPWVVVGGMLLWVAASRVPVAAPREVPAPHGDRIEGRAAMAATVVVFVLLAIAGPWTGLGLGVAAAVTAVAAYVLFRPGRPVVDRIAMRGLDPNVLMLFAGLYLLTAGLPIWLGLPSVVEQALASRAGAGGITLVLSNAIGNVPAVLTYAALDPGWTATHASFLAAATTLGGSMLLTGSAASLLAADIVRRMQVHVHFGQFAWYATPWVLPVWLLAVWFMW